LLLPLNQRPLAFQSGDWVLITTIENRTGEAVFDNTIEYGLERELGQSRFVNVVSRPRVEDTLALMRLPAKTVLTEELARQVAVRDSGIRGVIAGRIEKFDATYVLTLRLLEPASGKLAATLQRSGSKSEVVSELGDAADELRRRLGETPPATGERLEKATTTSLEALRAFSGGIAMIRPALDSVPVDWRAAAGLFDEAVHQDPDFALAHIYAAHCYSNSKDQTTAAQHYEAAFQLAPGVTERERLFILGSYYQRYRVDLDKARQQYEALTSLYPDDAWGGNNLAGLLQATPFAPELLRTYERIAAARPNNVQLRYRLYLAYTVTAPNPEKARRYRDELMRLRARNAEAVRDEWLFLDLEDALHAWQRGDVVAVQREVERLAARGLAGANANNVLLARPNLLLGRVGRARGLCQLEAELQFRENCLARVDYEAGDMAGFRQHAIALTRTELTPGNDGPIVILAMLARRGMASEAERLARHLMLTLRPQQAAVLPAWVSFARGQYSAAAKTLAAADPPITEAVFPRTTYYLNREGLAFALVKIGRADEGIAILQRDTAPAGVRNLEVFPWLHCRATLARLLRQQHRIGEAQKVEAELRHYLSQADPDHPLLAELNRRK
jgi:tetratricopeptide (TPR) repeat protein